MSWHGKVHLKELPEGRVNVNVAIDSGKIIAEGEGHRYEFTVHDLNLEFGGLDHDTLYIRSGGEKEPLLVVRDKDFLNALGELNIPEVKAILHKGAGTRKKKKLTSLVGWGAAVAFFITLFFTPVGVNLVVSMVPVSVDEAIGEAAYESAVASMTGQYVPVQDKIVTKAIEIIQKRLESGVEDRKFNYQIEVFESDLVNAVALPGGYIAVFSGLIEMSETPEELAGVIAHEMMHAEKRHGLKQIVRQLGIFLGLQILLGDSEGAIAIIADGAALLARLDYSRSMENEADREGANVMVRAKVSPLGLATFFEKLSAHEKTEKKSAEDSKSGEPEEGSEEGSEEAPEDEEGSVLSWLSTHPDTQERIDHIKKIHEDNKDAGYKPIRVRWRALKRVF